MKITIYVPSTYDVYVNIPNASLRAERTARFMTATFGGATVVEGTGYYKSDEGKLVIETVYLVSTNTKRMTPKQQKAVFAYAAKLRDEMRQESVAVEINDEMLFI